MRKIYFNILLSALFVSNIGCKKFLDQKQDQKLVIPENVADLQALLDTFSQINYSDISAAEISSDDYFLDQSSYNALQDHDRNMYIWNKSQLFAKGSISPWSIMYVKVYNANVVLYSLRNLGTKVGEDYDNLKGQALFLRGKCFLQIAAVWSKAYDESSYNVDLGIPLRLDPNYSTKSSRSTVKQTFDQIIGDLKSSVPLLPNKSLHVLRPSKAAAYGMLARTYLYMRKYKEAGLYADSCLKLKNTLLDYNNPLPNFYNPSANFPFTEFNPEVIYEEKMLMYAPLYYGNINPELFDLYENNDLRKEIYFKAEGKGPQAFKGDYDSAAGIFAGLATNEMYLIRAESYARNGKLQESMNDLNTLLINRWKNNGSFILLTFNNKQEALVRILTERRKELVFRRLRWMDIKRLNKEGFGIILKRFINNKEYTLLPNSDRYALAIPEDIIINSSLEQNP